MLCYNAYLVYISVCTVICRNQLVISAGERQKGLTTSLLHTQLDLVACDHFDVIMSTYLCNQFLTRPLLYRGQDSISPVAVYLCNIEPTPSHILSNMGKVDERFSTLTYVYKDQSRLHGRSRLRRDL